MTWDPPIDSLQNGIIRKYSVKIENKERDVLDVYDVANKTETVVTGLKPYSNYNVSLAAHTIQIGPYSKSSLLQLPEGGKIYLYNI